MKKIYTRIEYESILEKMQKAFMNDENIYNRYKWTKFFNYISYFDEEYAYFPNNTISFIKTLKLMSNLHEESELFFFHDDTDYAKSYFNENKVFPALKVLNKDFNRELKELQEEIFELIFPELYVFTMEKVYVIPKSLKWLIILNGENEIVSFMSKNLEEVENFQKILYKCIQEGHREDDFFKSDDYKRIFYTNKNELLNLNYPFVNSIEEYNNLEIAKLKII